MNIKKLRELKKNKKGFTLIEIIVVIVILAVLMAVAVPSVLNYLNEADDAKYMSTARAAYIAAETELVNSYTGRNTNTYTQALSDAKDKANGSTDSGAKTYITSIAAKAGANDLTNKADPSAVTSYVVVFEGGKTATLTPNGDVKVVDTE